LSRRPSVAMPIADGPTGTFTDYPFWAMQPNFLILRAHSRLSWPFVIRPSPAVIAYQLGFSFQYPGATGKLGRSDVTLISADNMFGNDQTDPTTKKDFQSGVFELAVDKPVRIRLNSEGVIHGFYIPQFSHLPGCGSRPDHRLGLVHSDKNRKLPVWLVASYAAQGIII
jgi:hypothetical protein